MHKNIGIIVQARTGSQRLPNKILKKVLPKISFIDYLISRLQRSSRANKIIVATSKKKQDDRILKIKSKNIFFYRGPEKNVIKRYIEAAKKFNIKHIIRITSDCPFADPKLIDKLIKKYFDGKYDYVSNVNPPSFPNGFDIEIFSLEVLKKSAKLHNGYKNREHVTFAIRKRMKLKKYNLVLKNNINHIRLTLDNKYDYFKLKKLANHINIKDNWKSIYLKNIKINDEK